MTYHNAVKYINSAPDVNLGKYSHDRIAYIAGLLENPDKKLKYIRLAGSNGKTICSAMLMSVLTRSGYNVCSVNMSDIGDVTENIKQNGAILPIQDFTEIVQAVTSACNLAKRNISEARNAISDSHDLTDEQKNIPLSMLDESISCEPTKSELLLLAALCLYRDKKCDILIIESAHNSIDPSLFLKAPFAAVICGAIPSNDKKQLLKIKTYIQRGISEVVSAPQDAVAYKAISDTCAAVNCRLTVPVRSSLTVKHLSLSGSSFVYSGDDYRLSLCGRFQTTNAITVIETLKLLRRCGYSITDEAEKSGMAAVRINARFEVISVNPTIIVDSTYKDEAIETVCESLFDFSEITGRRIKLCLPCDTALVKNYLSALKARGYTVTDIYTTEKDEEKLSALRSAISQSVSVTAFASAKLSAREILSALFSEDLLLISGNHLFTKAIREEIIRRLNF